MSSNEEKPCWKIIAFVRNACEKLSYVAVPSNWLENDSLLFWPSTKKLSLRRNLQSTPNKNKWKKYNCILKMDNIHSYESALLWERQIKETEKSSNIRSREEMMATTDNIHSDEVYLTSADEDSNELNNKPKKPKSDNNIFSTKQNRDKEENLSDSYQEEEEQLEIDETMVQDFNVNRSYFDHVEKVIIDSERRNQQFHDLDQNQTIIRNEIRKEKMKIRKLLYEIYDILNKKPAENFRVHRNNNAVGKRFLTKIDFPIKTITELKEWEKTIKTQESYKRKLIFEYNKIGGIDGNKKGQKIAPMLSAIFFSNDLLENLSWTGLNKKVSFQMFDGIIDVFFELMHLTDSRWTRADNISYFKDKLLKHSKHSKNSKHSKRLSHRNIASNAKMNKRNRNRDDTNHPSV